MTSTAIARRLSVAAVLLVTACSGAVPTGDTNKPPVTPPANHAPATVVVQAGDGQQAEPGLAVAAAPAVIVRDSGGLPVSGVSVAFAVDSGGGALTALTATTGANGIATSGTWTLGNTEGRNILKVTAGSLAPVRIVATAVIVGATFPGQAVGAGGGAIAITQPGPLNGFKLTVPVGAFTAPLQVTLSYSSSHLVPHPAASAVVGPMVTISSSISGYSASPLTIHIPATIPANWVPSIVLYDAATGVLQPTSTIKWDSTGVTAALSQLAPATALSTQVSSLAPAWLAAHANNTTLNAVILITPNEVVMADMTSAFLPGQDDWEFHGTPTMLDSLEAITVGITATEYWYFAARPSSAKLWKQYQMASGVELSNRKGIRWAAVVDKTLLPTYFQAMRQWLQDLIGGGDEGNQFLAIRTLMAQSPAVPAPQFVVLTKFTLGGPNYMLPVIVYKAIGNSLFIADPQQPGDRTRVVTFNELGHMLPYKGADGVNYDFVFPVALPAMVPINGISAGYQQVVAGTIGDAEFGVYPYQAYSKYGALRDTIWVPDTLRVWEQCAACLPVRTSAAAPEATASLTSVAPWNKDQSGASWTSATESLVSAFNWLSVPGPTIGTTGFVVSGVGPREGSGNVRLWLDWHTYTIVKVHDTISTSASQTPLNVPTTFTQVTQGPLPARKQYKWDFNDNTAPVTLVDVPNVQHTFTKTGIYRISAQILDIASNQPLATTTLVDTVKLAQYAWQFTSVTVTNVLLPPGGIGPFEDDTLILNLFNSFVTSLRNTPGNSLLYLQDFGNCKGLYLEQFPPGGFRVALDSTFGGPLKGFFGANCDQGSKPSYVWSLTFGTPGSGTLVASAVDIPDPDVLSLPGGSVNAVMNGTTLSGTFTWRARFSTGEAVWSFTFQANQVLPAP